MDNFLRQTTAGQVTGPTGRPEPQRPPVLAGYRTGRLLGVGGSASVWLVEDQHTGTARALKVFPDDANRTRTVTGSQTDSEQLAQLNRENAVLGRLSHPHLLELHGIASTDQGPALLMEYAGGGSLLNLVTARGRLSVGECVTVLAPIAQALAHLHAACVQHGDVSPGNVLLTAEGKPLLADLGVGRLLGEADVRAAGTAGFAEAANGPGISAGYAADVFSLAAIGWYSLTGNPPGPARERVPLTLLVPGVPPELLSILEAALYEDAEERPSAAEMADAVLRSAAPQPLDLVAAVHPSVLPQLLTRRAAGNRQQSPRRRFPAVLARVRLGKPLSRRVKSTPDTTENPEAGRRSARRGGTARTGRSQVVPRTTAALLVLCGALLAGPHFLKIEPSGAVQEPEAVSGATGAGEQGSPEAPAQQHSVADAMRGTDAPGQGVELSAEMRKRLAHGEPVEALSALVGVRAMVLSTGDAGLLSHVNVESSAAMDADRGLLAGLKERGHVFNGLSIRLQEASLTDSIAIPEGAAAVKARVVMSGYTEMDSTGTAVRRVAESTPQDLVFVLVKQEEIWKISRVHNEDTV